MSRTLASAVPLSSPDYYERLGQLQHGLRDSEKKRLDLEKKLYEYNQSDTCRVKLKYVKLKNYLKEICESEKKAHTRNQEYLKRFERVQAHVVHFTTNTEKLQKLKLEYETQIKKMLRSKDSLGLKEELTDEDREKVAVQEGINSGTAMSRGLYQPATIFMGRQMSAVSSMGDFSTEHKSPQPTKNFSIPDPHSHRQTAQSSNVTDSCVVQTSNDTQCLNHLAHGEPKSQKPFRKMQEEEEESWSTSSDLTISISEDDLILESPEPQPNPGGKMEGEDGIEALKLIHAEQERVALSTEKNCILQTLSSPDSEKESSTNAPTREPGQAPDSDVPRAQATALLRKALTEECGHRSAIHSSESSCSLPSILNDNSGIKEAKPAVWLNSVPTREQEVSSGCGDKSKKENVAAAIPITETEAYQLLKKATLQDNTNQTENRFQKTDASVSHLSGLNIGSGAFETKTANKIASEASFSSSEGSPLSRHENKKKPVINLKSNALWDESDDSNSEIEAALRPRNHNTDDSDDFYD
ncbi:centrosomal protein kizuna isoform X8 [Pan troglodytes]|uniref:centrosomal protein kizuna isoform X8 n=1 Tax=Pan troglodytes TaxID=9598 RepID=UPI003013CB97